MADLKTVDFTDITNEDGQSFELQQSNHDIESNSTSTDKLEQSGRSAQTEELKGQSSDASETKTLCDKILQCYLCKQTFERNEKLFDHIRWQHPQICLLCRKSTEDDDSLMFHLSTHSVKLPSNCKQCLIGFSDLARLQCHMLDHLNDSKLGVSHSRHVNSVTNYERLEGGYYCKKCSKNFASADAFHTHAFVDHKPYNSKRNTDFVCGYCNASLATLQQLKMHQSKEHKNNLLKSVRCHVCEDMFRTNREMRVHIRKEHKPNYYYKTLSSKFSHDAVNRAKGLRKKRVKNKSSEVKLCVDCGATFKTDDTLKRHNLMQHSEGQQKHACQICGKDFWTRSDLRVHIKRHINRENRRFTCDRCGKVFGSNASLLIHQRIHTGEKPYECPECKKEFRTDSCLNRHRRIHKGLYPHSCDICQKKFRTMSNLRQHLKQRFVHKHIEGHAKPQRNEPVVVTHEVSVPAVPQQIQLQQIHPAGDDTTVSVQQQQVVYHVTKPGFLQEEHQQVTWTVPAHQQPGATLQHSYYLQSTLP